MLQEAASKVVAILMDAALSIVDLMKEVEFIEG